MANKTLLGFALMVFVIVAGWRISDSLHSDAFGMAIGMFLGILASIPAGIIAMAALRPQPQQQQRPQYQVQQQRWNKLYGRPSYQPPQLQPPPVIDLTPPVPLMRGEEIALAMIRRGLRCRLVSQIDHGEYSVYDYIFKIGTRPSQVSKFVDQFLTRTETTFEVEQVGGHILIIERDNFTMDAIQIEQLDRQRQITTRQTKQIEVNQL